MKRAVVAILLVIALAAISTSMYSQAKKAEKAIDPVCGLSVDKNPELSTTYKGMTYYFCSNRDLNTFKQNPEKYARHK
jgi:YHS domain-containing protein